MAVPVVSIIGLPNAGKSTMFNRLIGRRVAIVDSTPGVTRDRVYGYGEWNGRQFHLIDTGGFLPTDKSKINVAVMEQAQIALEESDLVLYLIDGKSGPMPDDWELTDMVRKYRRKVLLAVNKMDVSDEFMDINDYYRLGLGEPVSVSGATGRGTGELLDRLVEELPDSEALIKDVEGIRIAILGRPNVGKSSIVNALVGHNKQVVDDVPGTTRDAVDTYLKFHGQDFTLIDTAGLRRKARVKDSLEYYTVLRTMRSIERADICLLLVDAGEGIISQDLKIADQIIEAYKPMVVVVNKWDLISGKQTEEYSKQVYDKNPDFQAYPLFFTSALTRKRLPKLLPLVMDVYAEYTKRIPTSELNDIILGELRATPPPAVGGRFINFYYLTQFETAPPSFLFSVNKPENIVASYHRFIVNRLRFHFGFTGSPIKLKFKKRGKNQ
ncbi:MAG: ribosome biogenesis GTPase Der [candidate division Zixibacteria bacterium]|nr:ribosome biogenesis GTPase Der [candidate division Zixibacteria bacterium]